jgi:hypothetical protein
VEESVVVTFGRSRRSALPVLATLALLLGLSGLTGCTARTLPLPPPDVDALSAPNAEGLLRVTGNAQEGAAVGVLNESSGLGVIVTSPKEGCDRVCPFSAELAAEPGDALRIWQFFETSRSAERVVPE